MEEVVDRIHNSLPHKLELPEAVDVLEIVLRNDNNSSRQYSLHIL